MCMCHSRLYLHFAWFPIAGQWDFQVKGVTIIHQMMTRTAQTARMATPRTLPRVQEARQIPADMPIANAGSEVVQVAAMQGRTKKGQVHAPGQHVKALVWLMPSQKHQLSSLASRSFKGYPPSPFGTVSLRRTAIGSPVR